METKEKILLATSELLMEGGLPALSVRAISRRAGLSTIGIYSHFQGKQGILDALFIEGFEKVYEAMQIPEDPEDPEDPVKTVLAAANGYLGVAEKYEAHYRLIFGESSSEYTPSEEAKAVAEKAFAQLVRGTARLLPSDTSARDKRDAALKIWALLHGFVSLRHHAAKTIMPPADWRALVASAMEDHIRSIQAGG